MTPYSEIFPRATAYTYQNEQNPPYGYEAIAKRKCGSGGVASPIYKQASRLIILHTKFGEDNSNTFP